LGAAGEVSAVACTAIPVTGTAGAAVPLLRGSQAHPGCTLVVKGAGVDLVCAVPQW
jgi:hypothetical protein